MAENLYEVLGVARDASADEISRAYRELAKTLHPDLRPGDSEAEERFKLVSAAYAILKNPEQREKYDRGEIDESGQERQHHYYKTYADAGAGSYGAAGATEDIEGIFADLFSGRFGQGFDVKARGQDVRYELTLDFLEAANGAKKRVVMPDGKSLDITVPAGSADGSVLRLRGKGAPGLGGGPAGDALVSLTVRPHPIFRAEGRNIVVELPISVSEAVLGGKVEVPTLSGKVSLSIPPGSSSGKTLRLKGKGLSGAGGVGDLLVSLRIVLPDQVDETLQDLAQSWAETHAYDPREGWDKP